MAALPIAIALAWASTVAALIFRAWRQFAAYRRLELRPAAAPGGLPTLAVVVPARNEADAIGRCLSSLAAQDYPADRRCLVMVDDNSTDGTAAIARDTAGHAGLRIVAAGGLPAGWTGKTHACWLGSRAAPDSDWLCFIDADVVAHPALLRSAVIVAARRRLDLLSLEPRQELVTPWERLVIPAGLFALAFLRDLRAPNNPGSDEALANGQFILIRRAAYDRIGGHRAVRTAICEDTELARAAKTAGYQVALLGAEGLARARMYRSLRTLWQGLSKNCTETLGGPGPAAATAVLAVALGWVCFGLPVGLAVYWLSAPADVPALAAWIAASAASLAMIALHLAGTRYMGVPRRYGLLFPLGYTLAAAIVCDGLYQRWRGSTVWKGRRYATRPAAGADDARAG